MGKLQGVADTLYIPLTARINISKRFPFFFYDEKALELEKELPDDSIEKNSGEYFYMASVCRYKVTDELIRDFISKHGKCNIVNLGAGLETAYYRIKPAEAVFYEMDLTEVIDIRRECLGEKENDILIPGDLFDISWAKDVDKNLPTMIVISGVFQYFEKEQVKQIIKDICDTFEYAEIVFDAMSSKALNYANKYVKKTGNRSAEMHFFVDDPKAFAEECGMELIEEIPFFTEAREKLKKELKLFTRIAMKVVDEGGRRGYILHFASLG